jgi:Flp pilus assembly protein TadG
MTRHPCEHRQRGAAVVEMALLLPVFLTIVFAVVDYGRFFFIRSAVTAAVADAARTALLPAATTEAITLVVQDALDDRISRRAGGDLTVNVTPETRLPGGQVTVSADLPFTSLILPDFLGARLFPQAVTAAATVTMEP